MLIVHFSRIGNIDSEYEVDAISSASVVTQGEKLIGNMEYIAKLIQNVTGGDIHFIETSKQYPSEYDSSDGNALDVQVNRENREKARPELAAHKDYCNLREQIKELMDKFPAIAKLIDERRELHLSEQEHEAYMEYRRLREEIGALERKYFYLTGQADMMPYMHTLQKLSEEKMAGGRYKINHLLKECLCCDIHFSDNWNDVFRNVYQCFQI